MVDDRSLYNVDAFTKQPMELNLLTFLSKSEHKWATWASLSTKCNKFKMAITANDILVAIIYHASTAASLDKSETIIQSTDRYVRNTRIDKVRRPDICWR